MRRILSILALISLIALVGCEEDTVEYKMPICYDGDLKELSCDIIQECYDLCDEEPIISWRMNCRDKFKPYLWKCYGVNSE